MGEFALNGGARTNIRLRVSTVGSGTITISSNASAASSRVTLQASLPPGSNLIGSITEQQLETDIGAPGATACASDTASCSVNQLFQRLAQRLTTLISTWGPTTGSGAYSAATVGTSASTILSASSASKFLDIENASASATVCVNFGGAATISGTQCAAGEITLPPLWSKSWEGSFVPTDAISAIASAGATQVTIGVK